MNKINVSSLENVLESLPKEYRETVHLIINGEEYEIIYNESEEK